MTSSVHPCPQIRLGFLPASHDPFDVLLAGRELTLQVAQYGDLGVDDTDFVAGVSAGRPARKRSVFPHRPSGQQQALDQVFLGHAGTVARAGADGDNSGAAR